MKPVPWWLWTWTLSAAIVVMIFAGLRAGQVFGVVALLVASAVVTFRERQR